MQDMTQGSITRHLIRYTVPMILGNLLQLTYNAVDSIIISKYLGENALAAVSTVSIFTGIAPGSSRFENNTEFQRTLLHNPGKYDTI